MGILRTKSTKINIFFLSVVHGCHWFIFHETIYGIFRNIIFQSVGFEELNGYISALKFARWKYQHINICVHCIMCVNIIHTYHIYTYVYIYKL